MPDDFNPFDDDSLLPDWMKDDPDEDARETPPPESPPSEEQHGLPPASEWAREPGRTYPPKRGTDDLRQDALSDLPWLEDDASTDEAPPDEPDVWDEADAAAFDARLSAGRATPDAPDEDWLSALERAAESPETPTDAPDAPGETPPWLEDDIFSAMPGFETGELAPPGSTEDLTASAEAAQPGTDLPDWLQASLEADTGRPEEPARHDEAAPPGPERQEPPLTFDAWEAQQLEREREAQKSPEERLLDEVPDWFASLDEGAAPPGQPADKPAESSGQEFLPEWYLGLEEQSAEDAPDWFQGIDYSGEALTKPTGELPPEPSQAPPPGADVPDWFKGLDPTGVAAWETGPEAPQDVTPPEAEPEAPGTPDTPELDVWRLSAAAQDEDEAADTMPPPPPEVIAAPEDIPFPDLELDQDMPTGDTEDVIEEWMADFAPPDVESSAPAGDFVERVEPEGAADPFAAPVDDDAPDWLRDLDAEPGAEARASDAPATPETEGEGPGGELDWLVDLSPEDAATPEPSPETPAAAQAPASAAGELPAGPDDDVDIDRLLSLYTPPEPEPEPEPAEASAEPEPKPEQPGETSEQEQPEQWEIFGVPDVSDQDIEALFGDTASPETLPTVDDLFPLPPDHVSPPADAAEPDAQAAFAGLEAPEPTAAPDEATPSLVEAMPPEWVADLRPTDLPVTVRAGGVEAEVEQLPVVDLPDQLQIFRETTMRGLGDPVEPAPAPESGPLAGIAGALPPLAVALPRTATPPPVGLTVTREQQARADRLRRLLDTAADGDVIDEELREPDLYPGEEEEILTPQVTPRPRRARRLKLDRLLVALLLLAGLIAPFATDALHFAAEPPALAGDRLAVAEAVDGLDAGDYVLLALEYSPAAAGELDPLAQAVLRDVLARNAIPLTLSTNAAGALHARAVIAPLVADERLLAARNKREAALDARQDYYLLGYLSGDATGVRALRGADDQPLELPSPFVTDLDGEPTGLDLTLAEDVALVIVVGETSDDVRTWAEQLQGVDVPRVALVTAAIEPIAASYVGPDGYRGYLAGYRDTLGYNADRNAETRTPYAPPDDLGFDLPDLDAAQWNSTALGVAVAAALIALGVVFNLLRALVRRRP